MSKIALSNALEDIVKNIPIRELGRVAQKVNLTSTDNFRKNLNKTVHILLINDELIDKLAPEARSILEQLPGSNGSAIKGILTQYRASRKHKTGRIYKKTLTSTSEKGYPLIFDSFDSARNFINKLGLIGRSGAIYNYINNNSDLKNKLLSFLNNDSTIFDSPNNLTSALALLKDGNNEEKLFYRTIYDLDLGFDIGHNLPVAYKAVELIASNRLLLEELVNNTIGSMRNVRLSQKDLASLVTRVQKSAIINAQKTLVKFNFTVEKSEFDKSKRSGAVTVFIESSKNNQDSESEARITNEFKRLVFDSLLSSVRSKYGVNFSKIIDQKGSKSFKDQILDQVTDSILGNKNTTKIKNTKVSKTITEHINNKKISNNTKSSLLTIKASTTNKLRSISGQFQSVTKLQSLISSMLQTKIIKNMKEPALVNRTGRFAESVELQNLQYNSRENAIIAFLTYMKYPYATFEPGNRQGSADRSPSLLIDKSVREIATKLTTARLKTIIT